MKIRYLAILCTLLCLSTVLPAEAKASKCYSEKKQDAKLISECLKKEVAAAEQKMQDALKKQREMAKTYDAVFAGQRDRLEKSQSYFLQYRDTECDYQSKEFDPRTLNTENVQGRVEEIRLDCILTLTKQRTQWLQAYDGK